MSRKPVPRRGRQQDGDEEDGDSGLFARVVDSTFANPAMSGGLLVMALTATAIASNALFLQTGRHPDPMFTTRSALSQETARSHLEQPATGVPRSIVIDNPPMPRLAPRAVEPDAAEQFVAEPTLEVATPEVVAEDSAGSPAQPLTSSENLVTGIQRELARIGLYRGAIDGVPGSRTEAAIRDFEAAAGIPVTGVATSELLAALKQPLPPRETHSVAVANTEAAELNRRERERAELIAAEARRQQEIRLNEAYQVVQTALNRIGYGPLPVDGTAGHETTDAIRRFELDNGMPITGEASDALVARLFAIGAIKPG